MKISYKNNHMDSHNLAVVSCRSYVFVCILYQQQQKHFGKNSRPISKVNISMYFVFKSVRLKAYGLVFLPLYSDLLWQYV